MNRKQRDSNRLNAIQLKKLARNIELSKHTCENCGEPGGHWVITKGFSLAELLSGLDDQEGFWTCSKLYDPLTLRRLPGV